MPVSEEHVFADIPKAELFALLIAFSGNVGILQKLHVEGCRFDSDLRYGKNPQNRLYARKMRSDAVFHRRGKPAFALAADAVVEPRRAIARFAAAACAPQGKTG